MRALFERWEADMVKPSWEARFTEFDFGGRHFKFTP
jgi:hypothetical protein